MKKKFLSFLFIIVSATTAFAAQQPDQGAGQPQTPASARLTQARARQAERWRRARATEETAQAPSASSLAPEICVICQEPINKIYNARRLPCNAINSNAHDHTFHRNCISGWIDQHDSCPMCLTRFTNIQHPQNIFFSVFYGDEDLTKTYIDRAIATGNPINPASTDGTKPLYLAAQNGHTIIVRFLVDAMLDQDIRANINPARTDGTTPLIIASLNGHEVIVRLLVDAMLGQNPHANINPARTTDGTTPLIIATLNGHEVIVRLLVEAMLDQDIHANINPARTTDGATPLFYATQRGNTQIAEYLREQIRTQAWLNI